MLVRARDPGLVGCGRGHGVGLFVQQAALFEDWRQEWDSSGVGSPHGRKVIATLYL